ncbi:MAG: TIGR04283 family arsenosugar biosynthesis glycosyltransferase [Clostridioides sp.]|jgi:rSAM/selenodomain-associated transferase 2|nr:TIGR04283 family arsenosugar biosynthesis glycosyltransferase [Clostridioides sp.]
MKVSIVVPVLNEEDRVSEMFATTTGLRGDFEVIFVDGGSRDATLERLLKSAEDFNSKVISNKKSALNDKFCNMSDKVRVQPEIKVISSDRGRAVQMNAGANASSGEILFFLHADSLPPSSAIEDICRVVSIGYNAGCFKIKFDSDKFLMRCCGFMSNLRVRLRNIAFGDQGIFLKKELFYRLGGYREIPLMEDYQLSMDIKKNFKIGQTKTVITTSSRRFLDCGVVKTMYKMQKLQGMYRRGVKAEKIADLYNRK